MPHDTDYEDEDVAKGCLLGIVLGLILWVIVAWAVFQII